MATNSDTLRLIIQTIAKRHSFDAEEEIVFLGGKGYLPKKMTEAPKPKSEPSEVASTQAKELAEKEGVSASEIKAIRTN